MVAYVTIDHYYSWTRRRSVLLSWPAAILRANSTHLGVLDCSGPFLRTTVLDCFRLDCDGVILVKLVEVPMTPAIPMVYCSDLFVHYVPHLVRRVVVHLLLVEVSDLEQSRFSANPHTLGDSMRVSFASQLVHQLLLEELRRNNLGIGIIIGHFAKMALAI